jgi:YegS/Rv2252/BmrU family lipid kinase
MSKNLLLIINPIAGKRKSVDFLPKIVKKLEDADYAVSVRYTEIDKNAYYVTKHYGEGNEVIICCGGDGTLKETICGVMELKLDVKIGYIPFGTTNDFAHSLHIPTDAEDAIEAVLEGKTRAIDIGDFCGKEQFIYVSCFGNLCDVSYKAKQSLKNKIGGEKLISSPLVCRVTTILKFKFIASFSCGRASPRTPQAFEKA